MSHFVDETCQECFEHVVVVVRSTARAGPRLGLSPGGRDGLAGSVGRLKPAPSLFEDSGLDGVSRLRRLLRRCSISSPLLLRETKSYFCRFIFVNIMHPSRSQLMGLMSFHSAADCSYCGFGILVCDRIVA